jgi:antitoxin MazE
MASVIRGSHRETRGTCINIIVTYIRKGLYLVAEWSRPMQAAVRKLGNSAGVIIPKSLLVELRLSAGDIMDMRLEDGRLILVPIPHTRRAGWAEASRAIAAVGDDALVWPKFGNAGDADLPCRQPR